MKLTQELIDFILPEYDRTSKPRLNIYTNGDGFVRCRKAYLEEIMREHPGYNWKSLRDIINISTGYVEPDMRF